MREKLIRFMQGRYGIDQFSKTLLVLGVIVIVISAFLSEHPAALIFYLIGWAAVICSYFRIFSRNVSRRSAENQAFLNRTYKVRTFLQKQLNIWKQRKIYHIYTCPSCRQKIRIPKGKGKIEIRCPKCGKTFIRKS